MRNINLSLLYVNIGYNAIPDGQLWRYHRAVNVLLYCLVKMH